MKLKEWLELFDIRFFPEEKMTAEWFKVTFAMSEVCFPCHQSRVEPAQEI